MREAVHGRTATRRQHRKASARRVLGNARCGFTLVEIALVVCIVGAVLAVAVPAFVRAVQTSKTAEASEQLAQLVHVTTSYYAVRRSLPEAQVASCLPASAGPAPALPSAEPVVVDFAAPTTPGTITWQALGFHPTDALRYRYSYETTQSGCDVAVGTSLRFRAEGDLDGDGTLSTFERDASANGSELIAEPMLHEHDRTE